MRISLDEPPGPQRLRPGAEWLLLLVLAAIQFTHIIDFMIMMPLGPRYLRDLDISPDQFALLVSAYAFSACLTGLLAASFIDHFDRKHALLGLFAGFAVGTYLCARAPDYLSLLVGRCVAGGFGGVLGTLVLAVVGDVFPEERRGLATGVIMSAFSVATIVGIPAGLTLAGWLGTWAPFGLLAALAVVLLLVAAVLLPPLRHHLDGHEERLTASTWMVLLQPTHLRAYVLMTCLVLGMFTLAPFLATYLVFNVGMTERQLPLMYLFGGIGTLLTMSVFGRLADRFGKLPVFRIMAVVTAGMILVLTNLGPTPLALTLLVTTVFMIVSSGRMVPAMALITSSARPAYRGSFMSLIGSVQQLGLGLASRIAGIMLVQPVKNGPLEGYPLVGVLACATTLLSVYLAGYVRPAAEPAPVEDDYIEPAALAHAETTSV
jgi:MFS transporter, DHA1 family, inner membrane transport protein